MLIGIDDTDSPDRMCTTYLGAVLADRLRRAGFAVHECRLVRLNPNVAFKTRGNAAVCIHASGDWERAFSHACRCVEKLADFSHPGTNPGVVVVGERPPSTFYTEAVRDFCRLEDALRLLEEWGAFFKGYKNSRGLIGATAAVCSDFVDTTYELLAYRPPGRWGTDRYVDRQSVFKAESATYPHTWDSVDRECDCLVCVPHTPDPVLFGIRGESYRWVAEARSYIRSEGPSLEQVFVTNQGTDAHLQPGSADRLYEGRSYLVEGRVTGAPVTGRGGHVSVAIGDGDASLRCMAYEPTKGFRDVVRQLSPGDRVCIAGSYKNGSMNMEKLHVITLSDNAVIRPPVCPACRKRMTSAGSGKGYKCRRCCARATEPESVPVRRALGTGWYEVPPSARRHLARPLCRGVPAHSAADQECRGD